MHVRSIEPHAVPAARRHPPALLAALALAGCGDRWPAPVNAAMPVPSATAPAARRAPARPPAPPADRPHQATRDFMTFALNALLVPLLDDDVPSRWADPSMSFDCAAARVTVDGAAPDVGAPVPDQPFTVHWHLERCTPLDGYFELSGDAELRVEPRIGGYEARVLPASLHIVSADGDDVLEAPFTARMGVGR